MSVSKRDQNEAPIVRAFQQLGAITLRLTGVGLYGTHGSNVPDLLVGWNGRWLAVEVKMPKGRFGPGEAHLSYRTNLKAGVFEERGYASKADKALGTAQKAVVDALVKLGGEAKSKRALLEVVPLRNKVVLEAINSLVEAGRVEVDEKNRVVLKESLCQ